MITKNELPLKCDLILQEPKLSAARRIVSEWTDYDDEMRLLGKEIAAARKETKPAQQHVEEKPVKD